MPFTDAAKRRVANRAYTRRYQQANPEKHREATRRWRRANQQRLLDESQPQRLKLKHGMWPEQWQQLWDAQQGCCYLCTEPLSGDRAKVHIDHDHRCCPKDRSCAACRRGLVHSLCNVGIGAAGDDPALLELWAANLRREQDAARERIAATPSQPELFECAEMVDKVLGEHA